MRDKHCDALLDYFNGQLTDENKAAFETHLHDCESCQEELRELEILTEDLPYASEPEPVPKGMKQRILSQVTEADKQTEETNDFSSFNNDQISTPMPKKKGNAWFKPLMAAALTLSLIGNGAALVYFNEHDEASTDKKQQLSIDRVQQTHTLQPSEGVDAKATAMMVKQNSATNLIVQADNLPELKGDEKYQVWVLKDETPSRAGTFVTNKDGTGAVSYELDESDKQQYDTIAITKEPNANSKQPKGDILLSSSL